MSVKRIAAWLAAVPLVFLAGACRRHRNAGGFTVSPVVILGDDISTCIRDRDVLH